MNQVDVVFQHENIHTILRAIAELHRNLDTALKGKARKQLWPARRNELIGALAAIAWFLDKLEGFGGYANVLNEFSSALADLDHGTVHAIFAVKRDGKPSDNTDLMIARCRVAIALACKRRIEPTRSKRNIADEIATQHHGLRRLTKRPTSDKPLSASIVSWYDDLNQGKNKNQEARDLFRTFQHFMTISNQRGAPSSTRLRRIAEQQLHLAEDFVPITKAEIFSLKNFIEVKRIPERPKGPRRRRRGV